MQRRRLFLLWLLLPYLAVPALGLLALDGWSCARQNAQLSMAAGAAVHAGLYELQRGDRSDEVILAAAQGRAALELGQIDGVAISARISDDRRSVTVGIHRPGRLCWSQAVGLAENRDALEVAALPPPGPRATSKCPLASFIPC